MGNFTISFENIQNDHLPLVGGKAFSLGKLFRAGFAVPPAFVITTEAYREFIKANQLETLLLDLLKSVDYKDINALRDIAKNIEQRMVAATIPEAIQQDILAAYHKVHSAKGMKMAVRSSAIAEDTAEASFAGQHDTFLGVEGDQELLLHVRKCWASLWNQRVIQYRVRMGFEHRNATLAVLVQQLIPADVSGVVFTMNPVTGNQEEIVINATWGLGETLVGGIVDADQIVTMRKAGKIKEYRIGQKQKSAFINLIDGGIVLQDTGEKAKEPCLTDAKVMELVALAKVVEQEKKCPQDIEWCIGQNTLYLLQARPITTLKPKKIEEGEERWTADNAQEAFPKVVSPYMQDIVASMLTQEFRYIWKFCGGTDTDLEFVRFFDGYVYLNVTAMQKMIVDILPGADEEEFLKHIFGHGEEGRLKLKLGYLRQWRKLLKAAVRNIRELAGLKTNAARYLERFHAYFNSVSQQSPDKLSLPELENIYRILLFHFGYDGFLLHAYGTMAYALFYSGLISVLQSLPKQAGITASLFTRKLGSIEETRMKEALEKIIQAARSNPSAMVLILREEPAQIMAKLAQLEGAHPIQYALDTFLQEFGHLGDNLVDLAVPRWSEDPSSVWKMVKVGLNRPTSAAVEEPDLAKKRKQLCTIVSRFLARGWRKVFPVTELKFLFLLRLVAHYAPYRENTKFHMFKGFGLLRRIVLRWGKVLQEKGHLHAVDDVFFLTEQEILSAIAGKELPDKTLEAVATRKQQNAAWQKIIPPREIYTRDGEIVRKVYENEAVRSRSLKGVPASSGKVTAKARVILDLCDAHRLNRGEILVTRFTDPAWTPLFSLAGGVVMDIGSTLSHGAVVARELGIPSVVGVRHGTEVIENGQEITVDGGQGTVVW